jgi:hypothetical protein
MVYKLGAGMVGMAHGLTEQYRLFLARHGRLSPWWNSFLREAPLPVSA